MASTRTGMIVIVVAAIVTSASVLGWAAQTRRGVFAGTSAGDTVPAGRLALDAPLPRTVPPGVKLVIGDAMTEQVLRHTGWDKELPFQVQWAEIAGGPAVTEAFHAKALDVGSAADIPPIHATFIGMPVKMIAVRLRKDPQHHPLYVLAVAPGSGVRSLADLRGKRIAFSPGQVQGEVILRSLEAAHLTPRDVKLVELPSTSGDVYTSALIGGLVDVAPIGAGVVARHYVESYGAQGARLIPHSATRDDLTDLYVRTETLEDPGKAAALRAYVKLWVRAQDWIATHPDEWARLYYVGHQGLSLADARYTLQTAGEPDIPRDWSEAIALEQGSVDLMAAQSGHRPFDAHILFDRRFEAVAAEALAQDEPHARPAPALLAQR